MTDTSSTVIAAENLSMSFGKKHALKNISLNISRGELFCLLGANGAGKSTLLKLWLRFLQPTQGQVAIKVPPTQVCYVPEQLVLYPELSGLENLQYLVDIAQAGQSDTQALREALLSVGLPEEAIDRRTSTYSKGMRQRVAIALASYLRSQVIILDEPLSGLDPQAADDLGSLLEKLRAEGAAIVMATHDVHRAARIGTHFGYLNHGTLTQTVSGPLTTAELDGYCRRALSEQAPQEALV